MGIFSKKLSDDEFDSEMRALELEIARERRKGELLKQKALLDAELAAVKANAPSSRWGEFFSKMGELGQNVSANLEAEDRAGRGWRVPDVSGEAPAIGFNDRSIAPVLRSRGDSVLAKKVKKEQKKKTKK